MPAFRKLDTVAVLTARLLPAPKLAGGYRVEHDALERGLLRGALLRPVRGLGELGARLLYGPGRGQAIDARRGGGAA